MLKIFKCRANFRQGLTNAGSALVLIKCQQYPKWKESGETISKGLFGARVRCAVEAEKVKLNLTLGVLG